MGLWSLARPGRVVVVLADVVAGAALVTFRFDALDPGVFGTLAALLAAAACLFLAEGLWAAAFDTRAPDREPAQDTTRTFLAAAGLTLAGLLLSMQAGWTSLCVAAGLGVALLFHALLARREPVLSALVRGACRGGSLLLGMTAFGGFLLTGPPADLVAACALLGLYAAAARLMERGPQDPADRAVPAAAGVALVACALGALAVVHADAATLALATAAAAFGAGAAAFTVRVQAHRTARAAWIGSVAALLLELGWVAGFSAGGPWLWRTGFLVALAGLFVAGLGLTTRVTARPEPA